MPWITSVGALMRRSSFVRSPEAMIAASWRPVPAGRDRGRSSAPRARGSPRGPARCRSTRSSRTGDRRTRRTRLARAAACRPRQKERVDAKRWLPAPQAAGVGHDRHQRANLLRVACRERLGDHPAHRGADHVRRRELELAQQPRGVLGHVGERVARGALVAHAAAEGSSAGDPAGGSNARYRGCRSEQRETPARRDPQKSSCQATICVPRPMISSAVGSDGSPKVS